MRTLQEMRMRTDYMMEAMRQDAVKETFEKWKKAVYSYYTNGFDNGKTTKLYKELEKLGASQELLFEAELKIREEVLGI